VGSFPILTDTTGAFQPAPWPAQVHIEMTVATVSGCSKTHDIYVNDILVHERMSQKEKTRLCAVALTNRFSRQTREKPVKFSTYTVMKLHTT